MPDLEEGEQGLVSGEFFLEYLPVLDLQSGRCVGAEALSRWRRPSGNLQPSDFRALIETPQFAGLLTCFVIEQMSADFREWLTANDAFLSFNVPPEIIGRGGIYYAAEKAGLMEIKTKFLIEITERGVPDKIAIESLVLAAERGIRIALDDVGTGGANIVALARANIAVIKIDRELVSGVRVGAPVPRELQDIARLSTTGTIDVIAEGVETAYQAEVLTGLGIRLAQGFYLCEPLSADDFKTFFAQRNAAQPD